MTESDGRRYALDLALHAGDRYVARLVKDERPGGRPYFEPDPDFSVNNIYSFCRLGPESTVDDVVRHAFDTFAFAYDPKHQHWGVRLYEFANGKSMLVLRFRHALTDGQGFFTTWARWSAKMDNCSSNKGFQTKPVRHPMFKEPPMPLLVPTPEELEVLGKAAEHDAANHGAVRLSPHHNSEEKKKNGMMTRQCASSCTIPLSELKRFKRVLGCDAVNDSVIAMTTGALAKVVRRKGLPIDDYFCYSVPKSLRKDNDPDLCNRIGINLPYIPSGISSVVERAHVVSKIMKEAKASNLAEIGFKVNASILSPWDMDPEAPNVFRDRMNISISNVPESPYPLCESVCNQQFDRLGSLTTLIIDPQLSDLPSPSRASRPVPSWVPDS